MCGPIICDETIDREGGLDLEKAYDRVNKKGLWKVSRI